MIAWFEKDVLPYIGARRAGDLKASDFLQVARRMEARAAFESAHQVMQNCGQVMRYAVATDRAERNPVAGLRGCAPAPWCSGVRTSPLDLRHRAAGGWRSRGYLSAGIFSASSRRRSCCGSSRSASAAGAVPAWQSAAVPPVAAAPLHNPNRAPPLGVSLPSAHADHPDPLVLLKLPTGQGHRDPIGVWAASSVHAAGTDWRHTLRRCAADSSPPRSETLPARAFPSWWATRCPCPPATTWRRPSARPWSWTWDGKLPSA